MDDQRFFARLAANASAMNLRLKQSALPEVAADVRRVYEDDVSGIALRAHLKELAKTRPGYFGAEDEAAA